MTKYIGANENTVSVNYNDFKYNTLSDKNMSCNEYLYNSKEANDDLQAYLIMMSVNSFNAETDSSLKTQSKITENQDYQPVIIKDFYNENFRGILNITPIQTHERRRQKYLILKYVRKWKEITKKKREDTIKQQRQVTVDNFLNKLQKKKCNLNYIADFTNKSKVMVKDYRNYQHRYKVQKHIIALQKAKLEEQNRVIEELKLKKITEDSKQSLEILREDVRKTYYEMDRKLKPKMQCLSKELKIPEFEEPTMILDCLKMPQFLRRMEARAREREEKHALIRERRKQIEEERLRLKQQEELEKAEMDKEEKCRRVKALKEKRKREKIENIRKKQHAERLRALIVMADLHYERYLMTKYGIRPLKLLMEIKNNNIEKAQAHYIFQMKKNIFFHWMWYTEDMWFERNYKAEEFDRKKRLKRAFECFKKVHREYVRKRQVAEDYYDLYITQLSMRQFRKAISVAKAEYEIKWQKANNYYNCNLIFKAFTCWRTLPALNALRREQELRKSRWRQKVLLVVPDYLPPEE